MKKNKINKKNKYNNFFYKKKKYLWQDSNLRPPAKNTIIQILRTIKNS